LGTSLFQAGLITLLVRHLGVAHGVGQVPLKRHNRLNLGGQPRPLTCQRLGDLGVVPEGRILDPGVQLIEFTKRDIPVKDAS
jgi:hypothetical protein